MYKACSDLLVTYKTLPDHIQDIGGGGFIGGERGGVVGLEEGRGPDVAIRDKTH